MINFDTNKPLCEFYYNDDCFTAKFSVCQNPICECTNLTLHFSTKNNDQHISFDINLSERVLDKKNKYEEKTLLLAEKFLSEIKEEEWEKLINIMYALKKAATKKTNLEQLELPFEWQEIENTGTMVSYNGLIPYDDKLILDLGNIQYYIEDAYCVKSNCSCTDSFFSFFPLNGNGTKTSQVSVFFNYKKHTYKIEKDDKNLSAAHLMTELLKAKPSIHNFIKKRHVLLKKLYRNFLKRNRNTILNSNTSSAKNTASYDSDVSSDLKTQIGRNEPCPCGSGKKYKKCCMKA